MIINDQLRYVIQRQKTALPRWVERKTERCETEAETKVTPEYDKLKDVTPEAREKGRKVKRNDVRNQ